MADEQDGTAPGTGPAPDIDELQAEAEHKGEPRTIEEFAKERGWKPKEDFTGEEADWRSAEDFISFGMDRNRDLVRDVKHLRDTTERMSRTQAQIIEDATERARNEERARLEAQHRRAVEDGDIEKASAVVDKIADLKAPKGNEPPAESAGVAQFRRDNAWFDKDEDARAFAVAVSIRLANEGKTEAEQLQGAREAVFKRWPEHAPKQAKAPPGVNGDGSRLSDTRRRGKGFSEMPAEAQEACRELVKRGLSTQEGYVKHYWNEGASA